MRDYAAFAAHIAGGRDKTSRKLCNNTWAEKRDGDIAVRLHRTDVLTFTRRGTVTFNTGGWNTVTTKDRINTYAPNDFRVYSDRGDLYLYGRDRGERWGFFDGITVNLRTDKPLAKDVKRAATVERENKARQRERARESAARRREAKREARIIAGVDALAAHMRAPYVAAADSVIAAIYAAGKKAREWMDCVEAIVDALKVVRSALRIARVVDAEPPADAIDAWHIIGRGRMMLYAGNLGPVEAGQTWHVPAALAMCATGLHASRVPSQALGWAGYGHFICKVKLWGSVVEHNSDTKLVAAYRKVVWVAPMPRNDHYDSDTAFNDAVYALAPVQP
jgi:hypothetical protein